MVSVTTRSDLLVEQQADVAAARAAAEPTLARDYWSVGLATRWRWYLSRAVGPTGLAAVSAANQTVTTGQQARSAAP